MTVDAHANLAITTVATAPSPAASGTSLVVAVGTGVLFPAVPFNATIWPVDEQPTSTNAEIVRVTGRATNTLTITRAQEDTSARTVIVGDQIAATITAKTFTDIEQVDTTGFANSSEEDLHLVLGELDDAISQRAPAVHSHSENALGGYTAATDAGNKTLTFADGVYQRRLMTADLIYTLPAIPSDGSALVLKIVQDGTGGRDATFAAPGGTTLVWQTSTGAAPVQNTAIAGASFYTFIPDTVSAQWTGFGISELVDHINDDDAHGRVKTISVAVTDMTTSLTTGDSKAYIRVNSRLNGYNLTAVAASLFGASSSGIPTVQLRRVRAGTPADMLSTKLTIDASEVDSSTAAAAAVIDGTNDDVATGDQIHFDIDVAGTSAEGLVVELTFTLP